MQLTDAVWCDGSKLLEMDILNDVIVCKISEIEVGVKLVIVIVQKVIVEVEVFHRQLIPNFQF